MQFWSPTTGITWGKPMSESKYFHSIALWVTACCLCATLLLMNASLFGLEASARTMGYENRLFDSSKVHSLDIVSEDWDELIENAAEEEYYVANLVIDGEAFSCVGIRAKGNTSLSTVTELGSERYSFKVEFDHYDASQSYYGLDKLSLNNLIQDSTMMKDYLTFTAMREFGVCSSLCSYVFLTVNGEDWGLYLALEGVEEAFLERNYGSDYGELYKPDTLSLGGGRDGNQSFGSGKSLGSSDVKLQYIDDRLSSYSNIWDNAKTDITKNDQQRLVASLKTLSEGENVESVLDTEQLLRYFAVHNYVCNQDSYTGSMVHNYYLYEKDGKLSMIPWDYNLAFGTFQAGDATSAVNTPIDAPVENASQDDRPLWSWIVSDASYSERYHQYVSEFLNTVNLDAIIENAHRLIAEYVAKDPTAFYDTEEFEIGVEALRRFCALRSESIALQLENQTTDVSVNYADASDLRLSDMGAMNMGKSHESFDTFFADFQPKNTQSTDNSLTQNGQTPPSFGENGENVSDMMPNFEGKNPADGTDGTLPERPAFSPDENGNMSAPDGENGPTFPGDFPSSNGNPNQGGMPNADYEQGESKADFSTLIWLAISVLILGGGLFAVKKYRA